MARFLDDPNFITKCREKNRKVNAKVMIDWFGDGQFEEIEQADDEFLKLNLSRELEGDIGKAILDQGTLVLDNSNNDYSPKSIASRFNVDIGGEYEFNLIPNRTFILQLSVNNSDFKLYYMGIVKSIEPNYDNSRVSITIEDSLSDLKNTPAPDKLYIGENAKKVIKDLLSYTGIDFVDELVDDIRQTITYNFYEDGTIFNAIQMIAEMVWGKFYTIEDQLRFINYKNLDQSSTDIVEQFNDEDLLTSGYNERYSSQDLYTKVELESSPLFFQGDKDNKQVVWSGSEERSSVTENYVGDDIKNKVLKLIETGDDAITTNPTSNVPIAEGSLTVRFGETVYSKGRGIREVDYEKGRIYFEGNGDYPLPPLNQEIEVSYTYYILVLPPNGESKELIAEFDNPVIEVSDIKDYVKFTTTEIFKDIEYSSYTTRIGSLVQGKGTYNTDKLTVSSNAQTVRLTGNIWVKVADYKFAGRGTDWEGTDARVYLYVDGVRKKMIARETNGHRGRDYYDTGRVAVRGNSKVWLQVYFKGGGDKYEQFRLSTTTVNVGEALVDEYQNEIDSVDVEQINYPDNRRTKLIFTNKSDYRVSVSSIYKGEEINNIYLEGIPLTKGQVYNIEKEDDDSSIAFNLYGKTLSIQNDLFRSEDRMKQSVDFLLAYYSTPKSVVQIPIRGRGHIDLMDKVYLNRREADIDNEFLINSIDEDFTEQGEWNQTLELIQAKTSKWNYEAEGFVSIIDTPQASDISRIPPPQDVKNLKVEENSWKNRDGTYNINLDISYDLPNYAFIQDILIQLSELNGNFQTIGQTTNDTFRISNLKTEIRYQVRVVVVNSQGRKSDGVLSNKIVISGEIPKPPRPSNFKVAQLNDSAVFKWKEVNEKGIAGYEIRRGHDWKNAELVNTYLKSNRYREDLNFNGTFEYHIKTIDNAGQYSINSSTYVVTFKNIDTDINVLKIIEEVDNPSGNSQGISFTESNTLKTSQSLTFSDYPNQTFSTLGSYTNTGSFPNPLSQVEYITNPVDTFHEGRTGVRINYITDAYDINASFSSYPNRTFSTFPMDSFNNVTELYDLEIKMSTSSDGINWSEWEDFLEGQYDFRYFKFKLIININSVTFSWQLNSFKQIYDVPDIEMVIEDLVIPVEGKIITYSDYGRDFYFKPTQYWASIMKNGQFTYPVFSQVGDDSLKVELIDSNDNNVSGQANIYIYGY